MKWLVILAVFAATSGANQASDLHELETDKKLEWWENAIFYQIYPRSFKDSDGDGVGDIRGIVYELEYIRDLGVAGIWLGPIFKSPMADFGYDISDFYQVDSLFGTIADLEQLFRKAKQLNLKIILDFVPNHTSDKSEWFEKSVKRIEPFTDFYIWHDGKVNITSGRREPPNNWVSIYYGSAWEWNEERQQYYYHNFLKAQPDLNYRNPKVVEEMKNVLRFWMERGAGGFRVGAVDYLFEFEDLRDEPVTGLTNDTNWYLYTHHHYTKDLDELYDMIYQWREVTDMFQKENNLNDSILLMTEAYTNTSHFVKFFMSEVNQRRGSHMPFNFVLIRDLNQISSAEDFKQVIDARLSAVPKGKRLNWIIGNHDQPRVGSRYGLDKIDGLLTLVMTLPGIAVTYYGEEIGMLDNRNGISYNETLDPQACNLPESTNWREMSRDPQRTPFQWDDSKWAGFSRGDVKPWLSLNPDYKNVNLKLQNSVARSTYKYYKQLSKLRQENSFAYGSYQSKVFNDNVFAYSRALKGHDTFVILINFANHKEIVDVMELVNNFNDTCEVVIAGADTDYSPGHKLITKKVRLGEYGSVILKSGKSSSSAITITGSIILLVLFCL